MSVTHAVVYHISEQKTAEKSTLSELPEATQQLVTHFLAEQNKHNLVNGPYGTYQAEQWQLSSVFIEAVERKSKRLPILDRAILSCKENGAVLIIPELRDLVRNESLTSKLIDSKLKFFCLDQPSITKDTLPALAETFSQLRLRHSQRIRQALQQTVAKLGNPNALKEITKVNKPKQENAVMFAILLGPIIDHYRTQGYSQRKIVDTLNQEGFLAPEGGQWVLSQLQKVLERIEFNRAALTLRPTLEEFEAKGYTDEQQLKALAAMKAKTPNRKEWDRGLLGKVKERLEMILDVIDFNNFVSQVVPEIMQLQQQGLTDDAIADKLNAKGIAIPKRVQWELSQETLGDETEHVDDEQWDAEGIELACVVAQRRQEDLRHLFKEQTLERSLQLVKA